MYRARNGRRPRQKGQDGRASAEALIRAASIFSVAGGARAPDMPIPVVAADSP
jgi:hypothetical protein